MLLNHVGIVNKNEDDSLRFYRDFLRFDLSRRFTVPADLSMQLFGVPRDISALVFEKDNFKAEVFICPEYTKSSPDVSHIGLMVNNLSEIIEKAPEAGVELIVGETKDKTVHFIKDFCGNLIEIKQQEL